MLCSFASDYHGRGILPSSTRRAAARAGGGATVRPVKEPDRRRLEFPRVLPHEGMLPRDAPLGAARSRRPAPRPPRSRRTGSGPTMPRRPDGTVREHPCRSDPPARGITSTVGQRQTWFLILFERINQKLGLRRVNGTGTVVLVPAPFGLGLRRCAGIPCNRFPSDPEDPRRLVVSPSILSLR